jgi:hypothetical protein
MRSTGLDVHRDFCEVAISEGEGSRGGEGRHDAGGARAVRAQSRF